MLVARLSVSVTNLDVAVFLDIMTVVLDCNRD